MMIVFLIVYSIFHFSILVINHIYNLYCGNSQIISMLIMAKLCWIEGTRSRSIKVKVNNTLDLGVCLLRIVNFGMWIETFWMVSSMLGIISKLLHQILVSHLLPLHFIWPIIAKLWFIIFFIQYTSHIIYISISLVIVSLFFFYECQFIFFFK